MSNKQAQQQASAGEARPSTDPPLCGFGEVGSCSICSDEALLVRVLSADQKTNLALVEAMGTTTEIDVTLVPGDWLLVHGGVAIDHVEETYDG